VKVARLLLVYNADWSLMGGLRYASERIRTGRDPCALCDLTYDGLTENEQWKQCRLELGVPVEGVYRNHLDPPMRAASGGEYPCVLAEVDGGYVRLLSPNAFETCTAKTGEARVECLHAVLTDALANDEIASADEL
jgi:hypothetical protein